MPNFCHFLSMFLHCFLVKIFHDLGRPFLWDLDRWFKRLPLYNLILHLNGCVDRKREINLLLRLIILEKLSLDIFEHLFVVFLHLEILFWILNF